MHDASAAVKSVGACGLAVLGLFVVGLVGQTTGAEKSPPNEPPRATEQAKVSSKAQSELQPASKQGRIQQLIAQLGSDDYAVRQRAQEELVKFGFDAYEELSEAANHPDLEVASRARYLLRLIRVQWTAENDPPAVKKILQDYGMHSPEIRLRKIAMLARLLKGAGLPALCRLVQFEKYPVLAKFTAIEIMRKDPPDPARRTAYHTVLRTLLEKSRQPAAVWLTTYVRLRKNPEAVLPEWTKLIEAEEALQRRAPEQSSPEFLAALLYQQAEIELERGKAEAAEETARRARERATSSRRNRLGAHLPTAYALRERGLFRWAEAEYRYVIAGGMSGAWAKAQIGLSEMFHDQGRHLAAAEARQELVEALEKNRLRGEDVEELQMGAPEIRARMNYLYACHWQEQGDRAKQRKYLDDAIQADPTEVDTLIACYRLPDQPPQYRRKIADLIERAASAMLTEIEDEPDSPNGFNQYAWLVGNTEGDLDKALHFAEKALELNPDNGAYCDTLARVYYTRGDLENAVKYQTMAHEAEPHSGLISKQLKLFQDALAKKKP